MDLSVVMASCISGHHSAVILINININFNTLVGINLLFLI